jgi:hypothetical protein
MSAFLFPHSFLHFKCLFFPSVILSSFYILFGLVLFPLFIPQHFSSYQLTNSLCVKHLYSIILYTPLTTKYYIFTVSIVMLLSRKNPTPYTQSRLSISSKLHKTFVLSPFIISSVQFILFQKSILMIQSPSIKQVNN